MDQRPHGQYGVFNWTIGTLMSLVAVFGRHLIFGRPSFAPSKVAGAETRMWQAYDASDNPRLGLELISLLRNMHGLSLLEAKEIGKLLVSLLCPGLNFRVGQDVPWQCAAVSERTVARFVREPRP